MTANAAQIRGRTFLTRHGVKYMGSYTLNVNDQKELRSMLRNFQLKVFQKWMKVKLSAQNYQNGYFILIITMVHLAKSDIL